MTIKHLLALAGVLALSTSVLAQPGKDKKEEKKEDKKEQPAKKDAEHPKKENPGDGKGAGSPKAGEKDIVETALGTGNHKTLCKALEAAGWVAPLKEKGPFTVFAPTDAAFAKLPAGALDNLLKPENKEQLANVLKYHVIKGASVKAEEVTKMKESANTVQGSKITISVKDKVVWLNGAASVTTADVACSNGVIHVIDGVLMPTDSKGKKDDKGEKGDKGDKGKKPEGEKDKGGKKEEPKKGG